MPRGRGKGFTLVEVMVAVAVTGLVIAGGFKLVTVSLHALAQVRAEREIANEAQKVYLEHMTKEDMPDRGEKDGVKWETEAESVPIAGSVTFRFRRLIVEYQGRETTLFLPAND